jgi:TolA-binding protein
VLFGVLLLPRRSMPDDVPLPIPSGVALEHARAADHELAARTQAEPLSAPVRALGSAIREYHQLEASAGAADLARTRSALDTALADVANLGREERNGAEAPLLRLRAVQLEGFLAELRRFEETGVESDELTALSGRFVAAMKEAGWCEGHAIEPDEDARRAMFKEMWNTLLGFAGKPAFDLSLDEQRALYAFYLEHPHPSASQRAAIAAARRGAKDARSCESVREAETAAIETWRLERIARLAAIAPAYPAAYARGVSSYLRGDMRAAARAFREWIAAHPEGPLALRAQAYLREANAASGAPGATSMQAP